MSTLAESALRFAAREHEGQIRKGDGAPYISHPVAVVAELMAATAELPEVVVAAAYLHDTMEDCGVTLDELTASFGSRVANVVAELTNSPGVSGKNKNYEQQARAAHYSYEASLIKAADKICNVRDLRSNPPGWPAVKVIDYIANAVAVCNAFPHQTTALSHLRAVLAREAAASLESVS